MAVALLGLVLVSCNGGNSAGDPAEPPSSGEPSAIDGDKPRVYVPYGDPEERVDDGGKRQDALLAPLADLGYDTEALQADEVLLRRLITLQKYLGPQRDGWQRPKDSIHALGVQPGQTVADIAAASGYFAWHLSATVGPEGTVYATEIDEASIDYMKRRISHEPPPHDNVVPHLGTPDSVRLAPDSLDAALMCDGEFFVVRSKDTEACLSSLFTALKSGGRLAVIESVDKDARGGVTEQDILEPFLAAGFTHEATLDLLRHDSDNRPGGQHYLLFGKP